MTHPEEEARRTKAPDGGSAATQPDWRKEFPIDAAEDRYIARRDFTKFMALTSLAFACGQVWIAVQGYLRGKTESEKVAIANLNEIPVGGVKAFHYPDENEHCLLLRPKADAPLVAYNQACTHLSCAVVPSVVPKMDKNCLHCPCHHGFFDVETGRPIAGPPRRPLTRISLEVIDGVVYAIGVERRTV